MDMSFQEFDMTDIETAKSRYSAEVKRRWGTTDAYKESKEKPLHMIKTGGEQ